MIEDTDDRPMCHTRCCKQTRGLTPAFHGLFCAMHLPFMAEIRGRLELAKATADLRGEVMCREQEQQWRKIPHSGHVKQIEQLRQILLTSSLALD